MTASIYPKGIFSWGADRVDEEDIVWANDVNSLAAEVIATENILGTTPEVEANPIVGDTPVAYDNVGDRISDLLAHNQFPVVSLGFDELQVSNNQGIGTFYGQWNVYNQVNYDPFNLYNGVDVTVPATGWYHLSIGQFWDWFDSGYHRCSFWVGDFWWRDHFWWWGFPENVDGSYWGGPFLRRPAHNNIEWQGVLKEGTRLRALSENGCSDSPHRAYNGDFKLSFVRKVPDDTPAG